MDINSICVSFFCGDIMAQPSNWLFVSLFVIHHTKLLQVYVWGFFFSNQPMSRPCSKVVKQAYKPKREQILSVYNLSILFFQNVFCTKTMSVSSTVQYRADLIPTTELTPVTTTKSNQVKRDQFSWILQWSNKYK